MKDYGNQKAKQLQNQYEKYVYKQLSTQTLDNNPSYDPVTLVG